MTKKLFIVLSTIFYSLMVYAQINVSSNGLMSSNNIKIDGTVGLSGNEGVLTIKASKQAPYIDLITGLYSMISVENPLSINLITSYNRLGNINYYVDGGGYVHSYGNITLSDSTKKINIKPIDSQLFKLRKIQAVSYCFKDEQSELINNAKSSNLIGLTPEIANKIIKEKQSKRIGLIAQDVENVFPEVVRTLYDGSKGILYSDLIAVLITAINELQDSLSNQSERISYMQEQINAIQAIVYSKNSSKDIQIQPLQEKNRMRIEDAKLYQNIPNPFNSSTVIKYRLPSNVKYATICTYDLNGTQMELFKLDTNIRENQIIISTNKYPTGTYIYTLFIDGQLIESKRMILSF